MRTKHFVIYCLFLFISFSYADEPSTQKKTIVLNMIVKDEAHVICRCLNSVKSIIDYWVIVDTGSTDNTQNIIKDYMKSQGIPGELQEKPWINFAHNRNEALAFAKGKGDYVLIIDADEVLSFTNDFVLPPLNKDFYYIETQFGGMRYARNQLIKNSLDWKWVGVVHEVLVSPQALNSGSLTNVANVVSTDGARSKDPLKYHKDAKLLQAAVDENPSDTRNVFYLAQSYRDAGELETSILNYQKRVDLGGWDQEVYWSLYQIASLQEDLKKPYETVVKSYLKAYQSRPSRVEPLYRLGRYYRLNGDLLLAYLVDEYAMKIPRSKDLLFVESWMYDYGIPLEYSIAACGIGRFDIGAAVSNKLLENPDLPEAVQTCLKTNLGFINPRLGINTSVPAAVEK